MLYLILSLLFLVITYYTMKRLYIGMIQDVREAKEIYQQIKADEKFFSLKY
jgi:hypothetical protein